MKKVICYVATSAGDWGGASRYLFVTLKKLNREKYEPIVLFPAEGPIFPQLDQMGIRYHVWGEHEPNGYLKYAANILKSVKFFAKHKVDLIHFNHVGYWRPAEMIAAKLLRIPVITHLHRCVPEPPPFIKYSSLVVANSQFTANHSDTMGVSKKVAYCSVDPERYDATHDIRPELGIDESDIVISFIEQIREIKGIDTFIDLAKNIAQPNTKFLIAGNCRDKQRFKGSYSEVDLENEIADDKRIRYVGHRSDIENIYRASDVIIMPSRWEEPFGLINIEAGAAKRPIIATRSGGIPEIIRDGENGYLVDKNDTIKLLQYTMALINDPQLRTRMGARGREIVETEFVDEPVRTLERYYDELTG